MYDTSILLVTVVSNPQSILFYVPDAADALLANQGRELYVHAAQDPLPSHSSTPFKNRYTFLCCSRNKNVATVCGPNLTKLGTHPLNIHPTPSLFTV